MQQSSEETPFASSVVVVSTSLAIIKLPAPNANVCLMMMEAAEWCSSTISCKLSLQIYACKQWRHQEKSVMATQSALTACSFPDAHR